MSSNILKPNSYVSIVSGFVPECTTHKKVVNGVWRCVNVLSGRNISYSFAVGWLCISMFSGLFPMLLLQSLVTRQNAQHRYLS
jgi:hypothetical protein